MEIVTTHLTVFHSDVLRQEVFFDGERGKYAVDIYSDDAPRKRVYVDLRDNVRAETLLAILEHYFRTSEDSAKNDVANAVEGALHILAVNSALTESPTGLPSQETLEALQIETLKRTAFNNSLEDAIEAANEIESEQNIKQAFEDLQGAKSRTEAQEEAEKNNREREEKLQATV